MKNKNLFIIGLLVSIALLLSGTFVLLNNNSGEKDSDSSKNSPLIPINYPENSGNTQQIEYNKDNITNYSKYIESTEVDTGVEFNTTDYSDETDSVDRRYADIFFNVIPHNTKPLFKEGDRFEYLHNSVGVKFGETTEINNSDLLTQKIVLSVLKNEKIEGREYYVMEKLNIPDINKPEQNIVNSRTYINTDTGRPVMYASIMVFEQDDGTKKEYKYITRIPPNASEIWGLTGYYSPWMLSLDEDFKLEVMDFKNKEKIKKEVLEVVGTDKIKDKECYKVEYRKIDENNKVTMRGIFWVDVEKRILLKDETYMGNLKIADTELVSGIK